MIGCLLSTVLFVVSLVVFHAFYIQWTHLGLVVLFFLLAMLSLGAMTTLSLLNEPKKQYSKAGIAVRAGILMVIFAVLIFGLTNELNVQLHIGERFTHYADNECTIRIVYSLAIVMYGALLLRFIVHLSGKKSVKAAGVLVLLAGICVSVILSRQMIPTQYLYPAYRLIISPGGVKTGDGKTTYSFAYSDVKYQPTDNIEKNDTFEIKLAKNEREGLQLVLSSREDAKNVTLRIENFVSADGKELPVRCYKESYIYVRAIGSVFSNEYPDALEPITDTTVLTLSNTVKDFEFSYFDDIDDALIEGLEQNQDFFSLLLSNDEIKRQVLGIFTEEIYKSLLFRLQKTKSKRKGASFNAE